MASLYLHIPFCDHKCIYCDFYSIAPAQSKDEHRPLIVKFIAALEKEITMRSDDPRFQESIETVFFGGGTPSLLLPGEIENLLNLLSSRFTFQTGAEITLETNPGTVNKEKLRAFRSAGINRISMGIQSFHDDDLKFLTRIHSADVAKQCVQDAFAAAFENVSFDLIFSLPSQTQARWKSNLEQAVALHPTHISCYSLIVEPETPLFHMIQSRQVTPLDTETDAALYEYTMDFLTSRGFEQYEVSNFAKTSAPDKPSFKCQHNINYWNHSNYLSFGPSAHSFWENERWWNISNISEYVKRLESGIFPTSGAELLTEKQQRDEFVFLGLRSDGIDLERFRRRFGTDFLLEHTASITPLIQQEHARIENGRLRLTHKGYLLCDEICQSFL
jgi:oxygen-independent coproporphyrinogen-3 oxidase